MQETRSDYYPLLILVGIFNRRYLNEQLVHDIERARRYHHPLSVVMSDIDHFKSINDRLGHRAGDEVLQKFVVRLQESIVSAAPIATSTRALPVSLLGHRHRGFVPTKEFTGELYVRWFQFVRSVRSFRSHGRTWKLRLPWGWNTGELGPNEIRSYGDATNPGVEELHNSAVEPICRKYLELRYRLMPYLYSAVREGCFRACRSCGRSGCTTPTTRWPCPRRRVPLGPTSSWSSR